MSSRTRMEKVAVPIMTNPNWSEPKPKRCCKYSAWQVSSEAIAVLEPSAPNASTAIRPQSVCGGSCPAASSFTWLGLRLGLGLVLGLGSGLGSGLGLGSGVGLPPHRLFSGLLARGGNLVGGLRADEDLVRRPDVKLHDQQGEHRRAGTHPEGRAAVELRQAGTDAGAEHEAQLQERAHVGHEGWPLLGWG